MDTERWRQVERLYHAALERAPEMRTAFLDGACHQDSDLRREVASLLAQAEKAGSFLERPALGEPATMTAHDALPGSRFGAYRILSALGAGGMGEVYRAHDSKLGRDVAIKTLPRAFASHPDRLARFRREARMLASLNHPNIAAIYGLEESGEAVCLVLELVEGETLHGPLPVDKALDYARQVAEALGAAHNKGIIHRDLKPANVKVTPEGKIKVLDFGLAKGIWGTDDAPDLSQRPTTTDVATLAGHIVGTPGYMSPEQARGRAVDERTDIWAFGCLLYELLSGKRAFHSEALHDTIAAVLEGEPDWHALPKETPRKIRALLLRCLEKDAGRRFQTIAEARNTIEQVQRGWMRWQSAAAAAAAVAGIAAVAMYSFSSRGPSSQSQWTQLTNLTDSAVQPALSPDGRVLTFMRGSGGGNLYGPGQIYLKTLPDGEAVQLTHDDYEKVSPVFSPDGSRIAYGTTDGNKWDTWIVPVGGGEARLWLPNSSGLVWIDKPRILFSEIKSGIHMAIVTAEESRAKERDVYVPAHDDGMAHRSYPSPDGKWALIVEMEGPWLPCRLVRLEGSPAGHTVGPPGGACTFAGWSPDGKWMYFSSSAGGGFHTWRQRFPDGKPQQITSGPTEEEGIAMAPDGRSLVTSVGTRQSPVWVHDAKGDRQISLEGYAYEPKFTPDGKKLLYRVGTATAPLRGAGEATALWVADVESGRREPLLPGFPIFGSPSGAYDVSPDGRRVVVQAPDRHGTSRLWVAPLDRGLPPQQVPNVQGTDPMFGKDGEIFFHDRGQDLTAICRVREDGTALRKALEQPLVRQGFSPDTQWVMRGVSPDGKWLVAVGPADEALYAFPLAGGTPVRIYSNDLLVFKWSLDAKLLFISGRTSFPWGGGQTYVVPLSPGQTFPEIPPGGFRSEADLRQVPGVRVIDSYDVAPGPVPDVYAYSRETVHRNLYRIPLP